MCTLPLVRAGVALLWIVWQVWRQSDSSVMSIKFGRCHPNLLSNLVTRL